MSERETFAGIPVVFDAFMPKDHLLVVIRGEKTTIHVHEGPKAGQDVEVWLREPRIVKFVNLGEDKFGEVKP